MSSRPSRSSSIPVPRSASASASARDIESLISIPFASPGRQQTSPTLSTRHFPEPRRVSTSDGSRISAASSNISVSPIRQTPRSVSLASSVPGRPSSVTTFEPRVVRGSVAENSEMDVECQPQPATSPSSSRRISSSNIRGMTLQQPVVPQHIPRTSPASFPRPTYLEYSSFKQLLQTDSPSASLATRKAEAAPAQASRGQHYMSSISLHSDDEESIGTPPPQSRPASTPLPPQDQVFKLPTRWSEQDRHPNLSVSSDGRELSYNGPLHNSDKDAAAARANHPIPPTCGIYYFEVEILAKDPKAHITIGFAAKSVKFSRLPGWEPNSWGYHGEDGHALAADKTGSQYGPTYGFGDIVGCGIDFTTFKAFYTKNGVLIGPVFDGIGKSGEIYPSVGLQHGSDTVRTNFGQSPFKFDIDYHVQQQSNATWNKILSTPLDHTLLRGYPRRTGAGSIASITNDTGAKPTATDEETKNLLNQLVLSYLVHHGYAKTARAFESQRRQHRTPAADLSNRLDSSDLDIEMNRSDPVENDIASRTRIVNSVLAGDIDTAIDDLQETYPSVLEADNRLILFKMRCRKFVELILETSEIKKKLKILQTEAAERRIVEDDTSNALAEEEMDMDIDEDGHVPPNPPNLLSNGFGSLMRPNTENNISADDAASQYESALNAAIAYGQALSNDYQSDPRPEVQQLFKQTFGIVAWEDPLEVGGPIAELVGHGARVNLAHELNQAILKSQGRPPQPALETLYRHTGACIQQLGLLGVGAAAFADISREFLQSE